jgi:hypothetical protein
VLISVDTIAEKGLRDVVQRAMRRESQPQVVVLSALDECVVTTDLFDCVSAEHRRWMDKGIAPK